MPFPRPRFTVRRLMIAVAVVAVLMGLFNESMRLLDQYKHYRSEAHWCEGCAQGKFAENLPISPARVQYYRKLAAEYRHAAKYPWLPEPPARPKPP